MTKVAFICVHNCGCAQIAEALCRHFAGDALECYATGTKTKPKTKSHINEDAVRLIKHEEFQVNTVIIAHEAMGR